MLLDPCLVKPADTAVAPTVTLGHPLLDEYLDFVGARVRPNTWLAIGYDLKVFFTVVAKEPTEVTPADVLAFIESQRRPRAGVNVHRLEDGERGLSARTIKRRLSSISGLYGYLLTRGDAGIAVNPVPRGLATRGTRTGGRGHVPLIRAPRTLPRLLDPEQANALVAALRTDRDRAAVDAMLLGGLRRCEVLGLRPDDLDPGQRQVFVAEGKGGHQRIVPISSRFFSRIGDYLDTERPATATDRVFVVLKGGNRGEPLSAAGLDQVLRGARDRAGLAQATCHQLRHTCLTREKISRVALDATLGGIRQVV